jgi:hypothetical protein
LTRTNTGRVVGVGCDEADVAGEGEKRLSNRLVNLILPRLPFFRGLPLFGVGHRIVQSVVCCAVLPEPLTLHVSLVGEAPALVVLGRLSS